MGRSERSNEGSFGVDGREALKGLMPTEIRTPNSTWCLTALRYFIGPRNGPILFGLAMSASATGWIERCIMLGPDP